MKLYYIFHSGFAFETEDTILIIDYYQDSTEGKPNVGIVHNQLLKSNKQIYVLSTHVHADHFNPLILEWKKEIPTIRYLFSKDILDAKKAKANEATYLDSGDHYTDENLEIDVFGSTDAGVSFLIKIDNKTLFHAGDLNNWHWKDESEPQFSAEAEAFYLNELSKISEKYTAIDVALFPVDQRLQTDYYLGAEQFIEAIQTKIFAPMHFGIDYEGANAFKEVAEAHNTQFLSIHERGEEFTLNL